MTNIFYVCKKIMFLSQFNIIFDFLQLNKTIKIYSLPKNAVFYCSDRNLI